MIVTLNPKILYFSKFNPQSPLSRPSSFFYRTRNVSLITNCKLQKPQDGNKSISSGNLTKTISLSESAPPVAEETNEEVSGDRVVNGGGNGGGGDGGLRFLKRIRRKVLSVLSNLPLAITEMFTISALMALGKF